MAVRHVEETEIQGENDDLFDFDKWVVQNDLNEIKNKLKEHELTTSATISTQSQQFRNFMSDPVVLSTMGHMIPQLFAAIDNVPKYNSKYVNHIFNHILRKFQCIE